MLPAISPSSWRTSLGFGTKYGLSFTSMTVMDTVAVDWGGCWIPLAKGTWFSAATVSTNILLVSKSIGWEEQRAGSVNVDSQQQWKHNNILNLKHFRRLVCTGFLKNEHRVWREHNIISSTQAHVLGFCLAATAAVLRSEELQTLSLLDLTYSGTAIKDKWGIK